MCVKGCVGESVLRKGVLEHLVREGMGGCDGKCVLMEHVRECVGASGQRLYWKVC